MGNPFIDWLKKNLPMDDSRSGSAKDDDSNKAQSAFGLVLTLGPVLLISFVYIALFLFFRRSQRRYYAPRTYLGSLREHERSPEMPGGFFNWFGKFWKLPDAYALRHQSLDAYLFLRYLKICAVMTFVAGCITWPILFPINATGGGGQSQLEILSYSNLNIDKYPNRLYAHVFVAWAVYGFIMYMIMREMIFFINLRQAFLSTPHYSERISSRTVLFTSVPNEYLDEARIRQMFNNSVKNVWIAGDTKELDKLVEERDKVAMKLEGAEVKLIKTVNKERVKAAKKSGSNAPDAADEDATRDAETGNIDARYIPAKKRPSHRLGLLGLFGKKVDTIEWGRTELQKTVPQTETAQADWMSGKYEKIGAVFVEFHTQADAQAAFQVLTHHEALRMSPKSIGVKPDEVVWSSLSIPWWQIILRRYAVYAIILVFVIFFAIPVAIIGLISQVSFLANIPGLTWIEDIPKPVLGFISGLLPTVALAILMSLVPVIMRKLAMVAGNVSLTRAELFTQNAYFFFQVLQVFLIRSLVGGAVPSIIKIVQKPNEVFSVLSSALPTTANFYISYFIVQGITIAVGVLTQVVGLFVFKLLYKYLAGTPRAMYTKWTSLSAILWGSLLPVYTNIIVIGITYAVIAPLVLFWASLALFLFWLAYRYNVLFVSETQVDTRGLIYPRALKQLFVGIYLSEIVMVGLFAVSKAGGPAALMVVFLIFTILFNLTIRKVFDPLFYGLPRSIQAKEDVLRGHVNGAHVDNGAPANEAANEASNGKETEKNGISGSNTASTKKPNMFLKFLMPWKFADYETLRKLVPSSEEIDIPHQYNEEIESNAYLPPSVTKTAPTLWIPRDTAGVSTQEVLHTSKVIPISDDGCVIDDKGNMTWDTEGARPPIYVEKVYY